MGAGGVYENFIPYKPTAWGDLTVTLSQLHEQAVVLARLIDQYGNTIRMSGYLRHGRLPRMSPNDLILALIS